MEFRLTIKNGVATIKTPFKSKRLDVLYRPDGVIQINLCDNGEFKTNMHGQLTMSRILRILGINLSNEFSDKRQIKSECTNEYFLSLQHLTPSTNHFRKLINSRR